MLIYQQFFNKVSNNKMSEQYQINRLKNQKQFQDCAQCTYCARYIPLDHLIKHQKSCFARQDKQEDIESSQQDTQIRTELIKIQAKKSLDQFDQISNQPHSIKKEQEINGLIKKISLNKSKDMNSDIVLLPCQNCSQMFPLQQFEMHQQICLFGKNILAYKSCPFCGQAFPENFSDQHAQVCPIRLELEKQTQFFNKKSQAKQIKPRQKKLKVTNYNDLNNSRNLRGKKSVQGRKPIIVSKKEIVLPDLDAPKISEKSVREVKKLQRSELKIQIHECSICFSSIKNSNRIYDLKCNHIFHQTCLDPWFQTSNKCPVCKKIIETK